MQMISMLLFLLSTGLLIAIASISPRRSTLSAFELKRREDEGSATAADERRREMLLDDVVSVQRIVEGILLILVVLFSLQAYGMFGGFAVSMVVATLYPRIATSSTLTKWANSMYERHESNLLNVAEKYAKFLGMVRSVSKQSTETSLNSRQELEHLVETSGTLLTGHEKKQIVSTLHFKDKLVSDVMTPRSVIKTIAHDELIGPLMLDELHRTGFSRFPVIAEDIDHVVGVLHIKDLLTIGQRDSERAAEAMQKKVYYINQHQTLDHALAAFLKTRHHLFVVVNGYRETVGLLSLEDVIETLLGREIVDEFDLHDDLRVVAERSAATNNNSPGSTNV